MLLLSFRTGNPRRQKQANVTNCELLKVELDQFSPWEMDRNENLSPSYLVGSFISSCDARYGIFFKPRSIQLSRAVKNIAKCRAIIFIRREMTKP